MIDMPRSGEGGILPDIEEIPARFARLFISSTPGHHRWSWGIFVAISPCQLSDSRVSHDLCIGSLLGWGPLSQFWVKNPSFVVNFDEKI